MMLIRMRTICLLFPFVMLLTACSTLNHSTASKDDMRDDIREMANNTLERLYELQPESRKAIRDAAGYAVFSNFGMKILLIGSGNGEGIAINRRKRDETFMKMIELQAGLGFGIKKYSQVWVFDYSKAYYQFINSGWEFGAQATAAAQAKDKGGGMAGAISVSPGVWLYQVTDTGLALELTAKGSKYYRNDELD